MKVAYIGHSYVRDISKLGYQFSKFNDSKLFEIKYFSIPGSNFLTWIDWPDQLHSCVEFSPNILVIVLGGNSIVDQISDADLRHNCKVLFTILRNCLPKTILISTQVELRFLSTPNRFGTPEFALYKKRRDKFNQFLKSFKEKDFLACVAGPGRIDNPKYYRDSVHLNNLGLRKYFDLLNRTVLYAYNKSNLN